MPPESHSFGGKERMPTVVGGKQLDMHMEPINNNNVRLSEGQNTQPKPTRKIIHDSEDDSPEEEE